jgi:hypothetical protein
MRVHFGLGDANKVDWIQVRWTSGRFEQFENSGVDIVQTVKEGSGSPIEPMPLAPSTTRQ